MKICNLLSEDHIFFDLKPGSKKSVIEEFVTAMKKRGLIENEKVIRQELLNRESLGSTGLEKSIAVPHAKTPVVSSLKLAIGISPEGIDFDALDKQPSKLFFLLVAAPDLSGPHVEALAEIAKLSRSDAFCRALVNAGSAAEVVELLKGE